MTAIAAKAISEAYRYKVRSGQEWVTLPAKTYDGLMKTVSRLDKPRKKK